jgi:hypothetical protein
MNVGTVGHWSLALRTPYSCRDWVLSRLGWRDTVASRFVRNNTLGWLRLSGGSTKADRASCFPLFEHRQ